MNRLRKQSLLGIGITVNPKAEILEYLKNRLVRSQFTVKADTALSVNSELANRELTIVTPNPEQLVYAHSHPEFAKLLNQADIAVPDGIGIALAARFFKSQITNHNDQQGKIIARITGVELMEDLVQMAAENGFSIGLIGGKGDLAYRTFDVLMGSSRAYINTVSLRMAGISPAKRDRNDTMPGIPLPAIGGVQNDGFSAGVRGFALSSFNVSENGVEDDSQKILRYFDEKGKEQRLVGTRVSELIYQFMLIYPGPLIIFVGLGAPKQEFFIKRLVVSLRGAIPAVGGVNDAVPLSGTSLIARNDTVTLMTVGGAFEMISGVIQRAPRGVRVLNLEWLWRLLHEPWRWRRQLALLKFIWLVWRDKG